MAYTARRVSIRSAFTIIEMLVVLVIIGILAGIVITLAHRVSHGGKYAASRDVVVIADNLLTEYLTTREGEPPLFVRTDQTQQNTTGTDDTLSPDTYLIPIIDGRYKDRVFTGGGGGGPSFDKDLDPAQPSGALLLLALTKESSAVEREFKAVDARFVQQRDVFAWGWQLNPNTGEPTGQMVMRRLRLSVLVDAYGNPLRFVHPGFQGGYGEYYNNGSPATQVSRDYLRVGVNRANGGPAFANFMRSYRPFADNLPLNPVGDADEGLAVGGHGYFYSPGADGDPGTRQDNVYSKQPMFPVETQKLN